MTQLDTPTAILGLIATRGPIDYTVLIEAMSEFASKSTMARRLKELENRGLVVKTPGYEANQDKKETTTAKDLWAIDQLDLVTSDERSGFRLSVYGHSDQPYVLDEKDLAEFQEQAMHLFQRILHQNDSTIPEEVLSNPTIEKETEERLAKHQICIVASFDGIRQITVSETVVKAKRRELIRLLRGKSLQGIELRHLGQQLGVTRTALVQVIKPLERAGLVEVKEGRVRPLFESPEEQ